MEKMAALKKIADEIPQRPPSEFEQAMQLKRQQELEDKCAILNQRIAQERAKQHGVDVTEEAPIGTADQLGMLAWRLKCIVQDFSRLRNHLSTTEQNQHLEWALRHLEDAQNQITLARTQNAAAV